MEKPSHVIIFMCTSYSLQGQLKQIKRSLILDSYMQESMYSNQAVAGYLKYSLSKADKPSCLQMTAEGGRFWCKLGCTYKAYPMFPSLQDSYTTVVLATYYYQLQLHSLHTLVHLAQSHTQTVFAEWENSLENCLYRFGSNIMKLLLRHVN